MITPDPAACWGPVPRTGRRGFLKRAAVGAGGLVLLKDSRSAFGAPANSRLNVALVGVGGRGQWFVDTIPKLERVVAICDVNDLKLAEARIRWTELAKKLAGSSQEWERNEAPGLQAQADTDVRGFRDFRRMLDEMGPGIDAVVVATPDHTHAVASAAAMRAGKHVFCEKPLTRLVQESRALRDLAAECKVATSMGNQGTASGPFRRALELIRDGAIGEVREVHVWNDGGGSDRHEPPKDGGPVPEGLQWDLWLGPARYRPYHAEWLKRHHWRDFGTNQLGNWGSHTVNLAFMALRVHELWPPHPAGDKPPRIRVSADTSGINLLSFPRWEKIRWEIPARAGLPPVVFHWYNGRVAGVRELLGNLLGEDGKEPAAGDPPPIEWAGAVIVGAKGRIHATAHNATFRLLPAANFRGVSTGRPVSVEASHGHERDWFDACRGAKPAWASFDYASALNEFLMLGNVATQVEGAFHYDPHPGRIGDHAEADRMLSFDYREGWKL